MDYQTAYDEEKKRADQLAQRVTELENILLDGTKINAWRQVNCLDECKVSKRFSQVVSFSNQYVALFLSEVAQFSGKMNSPSEYPIILRVNQKVIDICQEMSPISYYTAETTPLVYEQPTKAYLAMSNKNLCLVFEGPLIGKCYVTFSKKLDINFVDTNIAIENLLTV